jgi:hypothetical protein
LENKTLRKAIRRLKTAIGRNENPKEVFYPGLIPTIQAELKRLLDVAIHYKRKETLLFPYLEKRGITGPSSVMWAKDDEILKGLKQALAIAKEASPDRPEVTQSLIAVLKPTLEAMEEMTFKEEGILFPACLDLFSKKEWDEVGKQSDEIGYGSIKPKGPYKLSEKEGVMEGQESSDVIHLPTGSLSLKEFEAILNLLPVDITFVNKDDAVAFFSQPKERIFHRSKSVIGRKVQLCHPPASVHIVQRILDDFKAGRQDSAAFWINLHGKFIHIEYFAVRSQDGEYLGVLEVTQDLSQKRTLEGECRLLSYEHT